MAYWRRRWRRRRPRRGRWRRAWRRWRRRRPRNRRRRRWGRRRRYGRRGRRYRRRRQVRYRRLFRRARRRVVRQWEPNARARCTIVGTELGLFWGKDSMHRIMYDNFPWPIRNAQGEGGSMNLMQHTLQNLYTDNLKGKNRWSRSNADFDLCKYHGTRFLFPRHPRVTYTVTLDRTGHFFLDKDTYPALHPEAMLTYKRKIIIWSRQERPKGRNYIRVQMPPPQTMMTKWFFQRDFCKLPLFTLLITAWDPINSHIPPVAYNSSVLLWGFPYYSRPMPYDCFADFLAKCMGPQDIPWNRRQTTIETEWLDQQYWDEFKKEWQQKFLDKYDNASSTYNWTEDKSNVIGDHINDPEGKKAHYENNKEIQDKDKETRKSHIRDKPRAHNKKLDTANSAWEVVCLKLGSIHFGMKTTAKCMNYDMVAAAWLPTSMQKQTQTIGISLGRWSANWPTTWATDNECKQQTPFSYRYSWREDEGRGNQISIWTRDCRDDVPEADCELRDKPLYILANGYADFVIKHTMHNPLNWQVRVDCPWTYPPMRGVIPVAKDWFKTVLTPGNNKVLQCEKDDGYIQDWCKKNNTEKEGWKAKCRYPPVSGNTIVMQGTIIRSPDIFDSEAFFQTLYGASPFSLKFNNTNESITFFYKSLWTWGGDFPHKKAVEDPCNKPKWGTLPVTGFDERGVLLQDPTRNDPRDKAHVGDLRRGNLTKGALKRLMRLDSTDGDSPQKKIKKGKGPETYADQVRPEDVFMWISSPGTTPEKNNNTSRQQWLERYDGNVQGPSQQKYKTLLEALWEERQKQRKHRRILRKLLRRQLEEHHKYRLLLG
nr:ORF1 [Epsilontorquevirus sp.]